MTTHDGSGLFVLDRAEGKDGLALRRAKQDSLEGVAYSPSARALVQSVFEKVREYDPRQRVGPDRLEKLKQGTEAFLSALLLAQALDENGRTKSTYVAIPTGAAQFQNRSVSHRTFDVVRGAFEQMGLVVTKPGYATTFTGGKGGYTRFGATESLLELSLQFGINPAEAARHFKPGLPNDPLMLKAKRFRGDLEAGRVLKIPKHLEAGAAKLREEVRALNSFLHRQELSNCVHHGYIRTFNCGDMPEFNWDMGGRLYSQGPGNYQQIPESERLKIRMNGDGVCELDFRASYLSIFHALHGVQLSLSTDPYKAAGLSDSARDAAKWWVVVSTGKGKLLSKWPSTVVKEVQEKSGLDLSRHPVADIKKALLASYPLLACIEQDEDPRPLWARLMFTESQMLLETMSILMSENTPSLAMHDGLIVPQKHQARAEEVLRGAFKRLTGFENKLTVSLPPAP